MDGVPTTIEERDDTGRLLLRCAMAGGALHGDYEEYGPAGLPALAAHFAHGKLHGTMRAYGPDGALVQRGEFRHGAAHGLMETFVNGRRVAAQEMADGVASGPSLSYDEAGQVTARLTFAAGKPDGPATFYHEGREVRSAVYRNGLLDGEAVDRDGHGTVVQRCTYRANLLHGAVRRFWPDGALMEEVHYRDGVPVEEPARYDRRGKRIGHAEAAPALFERIKALLRGNDGTAGMRRRAAQVLVRRGARHAERAAAKRRDDGHGGRVDHGQQADGERDVVRDVFVARQSAGGRRHGGRAGRADADAVRADDVRTVDARCADGAGGRHARAERRVEADVHGRRRD